MPHAIRPGDVLADRYRLVDLLSESGDGRCWRAHDRVLERHVALHVIAEDDPRAPALLEAARRSATVHDPRILRVLDAESTGGVCYVVNEWGDGTSLDTVVATHGPLAPRPAAWMVAELAESVAAAHAAGVAHGRLVPENVLVHSTGAVRVIGLAVDAALHGLGPGTAAADVTDLAGILYCALTGRWAGAAGSAVPAAPLDQGRPLRPRQVRAGVPRPLDVLCGRLLHSAEPGVADETRPSAAEVALLLRDFVGDPAGLAEQLAATHLSPGGTVALRQVPAADAGDPGATRVVRRTGSSPISPPAPESTSGTHPAGPSPTQAGMPVFDDENDDVSWLVARSVPPPPPPPFEEPPERPLFAPPPTDGEPPRRSRPSVGVASGAGDDTAYRPWADETRHGAPSAVPGTEEVPGRGWLRLAMGLTAALLLLVAVVVAVNLGRGRTPLGQAADDEPARSSPTPAPSASPVPLGGLTATDLDPQGGGDGENPESVANVVDGDPSTTWRTSTYYQQLGPTGLKTGLGLVLDLGGEREVSDVALDLVGEPTGVSLYLADTAPADVADLEPLVTRRVGTRERIRLPEPASGRFLVVWLTSLPAVPDGFRGEVAEVTVRG